MQKALFGRKISDLEELKLLTEEALEKGKTGSAYVVDKEVYLNNEDFEKFADNFLRDQDWIPEGSGGPSEEGYLCIRVLNTETQEAVLVNPEGYGYPRYVALEREV
jgi:hypothetical protein